MDDADTPINTKSCLKRFSRASTGTSGASKAFSCSGAISAGIEFVTIMIFDSLDAVREFAGEDYEAAVVPKSARAVLSHFDDRSRITKSSLERTGEEIRRLVTARAK